VFEEILFRGMLFTYIKKYNKLLAYLGISFLFYYYHSEAAVVGHLIGSMLYCWSYEKYGTLVAPIALHFLNNFLFLLTLFKENLM
jgi:membrane protease YdiL (CAAX protease family)